MLEKKFAFKPLCDFKGGKINFNLAEKAIYLRFKRISHFFY
jgi:hypothetical protein